MNLRLFHAVLILLSAALAVLFGIWCLDQYGRDAGATPLIAGVAAFAVSLGLVAYDSWFLRKTRTLTLARGRRACLPVRRASRAPPRRPR